MTENNKSKDRSAYMKSYREKQSKIKKENAAPCLVCKSTDGSANRKYYNYCHYHENDGFKEYMESKGLKYCRLYNKKCPNPILPDNCEATACVHCLKKEAENKKKYKKNIENDNGAVNKIKTIIFNNGVDDGVDDKISELYDKIYIDGDKITKKCSLPERDNHDLVEFLNNEGCDIFTSWLKRKKNMDPTCESIEKIILLLTSKKSINTDCNQVHNKNDQVNEFDKDIEIVENITLDGKNDMVNKIHLKKTEQISSLNIEYNHDIIKHIKLLQNELDNYIVMENLDIERLIFTEKMLQLVVKLAHMDKNNVTQEWINFANGQMQLLLDNTEIFNKITRSENVHNNNKNNNINNNNCIDTNNNNNTDDNMPEDGVKIIKSNKEYYTMTDEEFIKCRPPRNTAQYNNWSYYKKNRELKKDIIPEPEKDYSKMDFKKMTKEELEANEPPSRLKNYKNKWDYAWKKLYDQVKN